MRLYIFQTSSENVVDRVPLFGRQIDFFDRRTRGGERELARELYYNRMPQHFERTFTVLCFFFADLSVLDSLMSMVKPGNNVGKDRLLYYCPKCLHSFTLKSNRNRHYKYECGHEPRFKCPYCKLRSKQTSQIYSHIRKKHPEERVCVIDLKF